MKTTDNDSIAVRYAESIRGTISCFDRLLFQGTLNPIGHPEGMTSYLYGHGIRIFDFPEFAKSYTEKIRDHIAHIASENAIPIHFVRKTADRKEDIVASFVQNRGNHPGVVCILSAMESCSTFQPWHDKQTHRTFLRHDSGKCLHYYVYLIDPTFGLCHVRIPTWLPCRIQVYVNGHNWLASQLKHNAITFSLVDNLFTHISDFAAAQSISDSFSPEQLHIFLDQCVGQYCPFYQSLDAQYHWSIMQAEYATDLIFSNKDKLATLYDHISRTAALAVKAQNIATFLGRKLNQNYQDEVGNNFSTRIEGTRIRHVMGPTSIKAYDKFATALRIETTSNDVSFFKHYRDVQQHDGTIVNKIASMRKSIYSMCDLARVMHDANQRYLDFLSALDDPSAAAPVLHKLSATITENNHPYKGINFFSADDLDVVRFIARGEFNISGFQNKSIRHELLISSSAKATRIIKRLRVHGIIRKVNRSYKYRLTRTGKQVVALGLKLREFFVVPQIALCY